MSRLRPAQRSPPRISKEVSDEAEPRWLAVAFRWVGLVRPPIHCGAPIRGRDRTELSGFPFCVATNTASPRAERRNRSGWLDRETSEGRYLPRRSRLGRPVCVHERARGSTRAATRSPHPTARDSRPASRSASCRNVVAVVSHRGIFLGPSGCGPAGRSNRCVDCRPVCPFAAKG